jgi:hypothetical protein
MKVWCYDFGFEKSLSNVVWTGELPTCRAYGTFGCEMGLACLRCQTDGEVVCKPTSRIIWKDTPYGSEYMSVKFPLEVRNGTFEYMGKLRACTEVSARIFVESGSICYLSERFHTGRLSLCGLKLVEAVFNENAVQIYPPNESESPEK